MEFITNIKYMLYARKYRNECEESANEYLWYKYLTSAT